MTHPNIELQLFAAADLVPVSHALASPLNRLGETDNKAPRWNSTTARFWVSKLRQAIAKSTDHQVHRWVSTVRAQEQRDSLRSLRDEQGQAILHWVCASGHRLAARLIVSWGLNELPVDQRLRTPLHVSSTLETFAIVWSVSRLHDRLAQDDQGNNALHIQAAHGRRDIVRALLMGDLAQAMLRQVNHLNESPLFPIARQTSDLLMLALSMGADPRKKNREGQNPIDACSDQKNRKQMEEFAKHMGACEKKEQKKARQAWKRRRARSLATKALQFVSASEEQPDAI